MSVYSELIALYRKKAGIEAKLAKIKKDIEAAEEPVDKALIEDGLSEVKLPTGTIKPERIIRASAGGDMPSLCEAMEAAGKGDMVKDTVNGTSLGAWVREFDPDNTLSPKQIEAKLPSKLRGKINITEQNRIKVTLKKGK